MTGRKALIQCYHSGQMSAAQWERHCEDDPVLRKMVEAKGGEVDDGYGPSERSDGQNRPVDASPGVKTEAIDSIAAVLEALKPFAKVADHIHEILSDEATGYGGGIKVKDFRRARAAYAAAELAVSRVEELEAALAAEQEALAPFAAEADRPDWQDRPDSDGVFVPLGDLRKARAVIGFIGKKAKAPEQDDSGLPTAEDVRGILK